MVAKEYQWNPNKGMLTDKDGNPRPPAEAVTLQPTDVYADDYTTGPTLAAEVAPVPEPEVETKALGPVEDKSEKPKATKKAPAKKAPAKKAIKAEE